MPANMVSRSSAALPFSRPACARSPSAVNAKTICTSHLPLRCHFRAVEGRRWHCARWAHNRLSREQAVALIQAAGGVDLADEVLTKIVERTDCVLRSQMS